MWEEKGGQREKSQGALAGRTDADADATDGEADTINFVPISELGFGSAAAAAPRSNSQLFLLYSFVAEIETTHHFSVMSIHIRVLLSPHFLTQVLQFNGKHVECYFILVPLS